LNEWAALLQQSLSLRKNVEAASSRCSGQSDRGHQSDELRERQYSTNRWQRAVDCVPAGLRHSISWGLWAGGKSARL